MSLDFKVTLTLASDQEETRITESPSNNNRKNGSKVVRVIFLTTIQPCSNVDKASSLVSNQQRTRRKRGPSTNDLHNRKKIEAAKTLFRLKKPRSNVGEALFRSLASSNVDHREP